MRVNENTKDLIHALFSFAKVRGEKVYMDEATYKRFAIKSTVTIDGKPINTVGYTENLVCHDYKESCEGKHLSLDYNSIYGGFVVEQFYNTGGAIDHPLRTSPRRFDAETLSLLLRSYTEGYADAEAEHGVSWSEDED